MQRDLNQLKADKVLSGTVESLSAIGYRHQFSLSKDETLLDVTATPLSNALKQIKKPRALIFQHCNAESAVLPFEPDDTTWASRNRYFPAALMEQLGLDDVPYFCSFASGCAGFMSLLVTAGGLFSSSTEDSAVCVMADTMPTVPVGLSYDMLHERILGSDHSSAFLVGREQQGYEVLGISYYSTTRRLVPLVEIVKRTVQMTQELASGLRLNLRGSNVAIHYPNIFPDAWKMTTKYLKIPGADHVMDGMAERAHCGATDSVISLAKLHGRQEGRLHVVVNYGVGLHLGVCILRERGGEEPRSDSDFAEQRLVPEMMHSDT